MGKMTKKSGCLLAGGILSLISLAGIAVIMVIALFAFWFFVMLLDDVTKSVNDELTGEEFYRSTGGWDFRRIPLIEPYQAINVGKNSPWSINLRTDAMKYQFGIDAEELNVIDNKYIITYASNTIFQNRSFEHVWFVIIPEENIEEGFTDEKSFLSYLETRNIHSPDLIETNNLYQQLIDKGYLEWFPEEYKKQNM